MNQRSDKFYEIVEDFKVTRSYAETGRNCGVSRQRVQQVIKKSGINIKPKLRKNKWVGKKCENCHTPLTKDTRRGNLCKNCYGRLLRTGSTSYKYSGYKNKKGGVK